MPIRLLSNLSIYIRMNWPFMFFSIFHDGFWECALLLTLPTCGEV